MRQQLLEPVPFAQARQPIQHSIAAGSLRQQCFHKARLSGLLYRHRHLPRPSLRESQPSNYATGPQGERWYRASGYELIARAVLHHLAGKPVTQSSDFARRWRGKMRGAAQRIGVAIALQETAP